jgi:hypothetical protein
MKKLIGLALAGGFLVACAHDNGGALQTPGQTTTPMSQQGGTSDANGGGSSIGSGQGNMQGSSTGPNGIGGSNSQQQGSDESSPTTQPPNTQNISPPNP